ncbi:hypothetical protein LCGC14_2562400 [marine sediment metagenome]|uniref:DUF1360 domain-containing protein n=1 Tax=marine sediment metagenome TaxID=412755 RepID=A0A0F9AJM8_9ZZZZ
MNLVILALAVARLTRLVTQDSITQTIREWVLTRWPDASSEFGDSEVTEQATDALGYRTGTLETGREVFRTTEAWYAVAPFKWSELLTCDWCLSIWVGIGAAAAYYLYPEITFWVSLPLALSFVAAWLNEH